MTFSELIEYAKTDGPNQWYREFINEFNRLDPAIIGAIRYLWSVYDQCPDRADDDHDEWCRQCAAFLWLVGE